MKKGFMRIVNYIFVLVFALAVCGCGKVSIDYGDAESFEAALNAGENLEGKVVRFTALELHPDSAAGYNVWAGEHLNFISSRNPDIKVGDIVVVRADEITSLLGSWFIKYEKVGNAEVTDVTVLSTGKSGINGQTAETQAEQAAEAETEMPAGNDTASSTGDTGSSSSFSVGNSAPEEQKALEIVDYGWGADKDLSNSDSVYIRFCVMIHNPNKTLIAEFPKAIVTVKNGDGSILATEDQTGSIIMPEDTVTLCGMFSMPIADIQDAKIGFGVDWNGFTTGSTIYAKVKTSDLVISNVTERSASNGNYITGELTNNSTVDVSMVNLSIVLRKEGKIVYVENTFVDGPKPGATRAFEVQRYSAWPEHDTIECSAMSW